MNPLDEAIERAGGVSRLAQKLGITQGAVSGWKLYGGRVPAARVLTVESLTGVSRYALRPDIFGPFPAPRAARPSIFPFIPAHDSQAEVVG